VKCYGWVHEDYLVSPICSKCVNAWG